MREELNVKALRFVAAADELGPYEIKPNYRALGPRFGKRMPQVAAAIAALDPAHVAAALRDGPPDRHRDRRPRPPARPDDLELAMQPLEGYQLEREGSHAVALELALDDELRREGLAREVVHAVQAARKAAGLDGRGPDRADARRRRRAARRRARARGLRGRRDAGDRGSPMTAPTAASLPTIEGRTAADPDRGRAGLARPRGRQARARARRASSWGRRR